MDFKPIPIGIENFKELIDKECYYVDKTLMIKDILDNCSKVNLYTRPRRFGKTLNMSMIQYYFENTDKDNSYLFDGLNISKAGDKYSKHMGQYPVISISLKSMKQSSYEESFYQHNRYCPFWWGHPADAVHRRQSRYTCTGAAQGRSGV